jgi:hypothetical protein
VAARTALDELLTAARRRTIVQLAADHSSLALAAAFGAAAVLLLAGSQLLHPAWLIALALLAVVLFGRGIWRQLPDRYRLAQHIDRRLSLHDTLSTAVAFAGDASPITDIQRSIADRTAATLNAQQAVPLHWPKSLTATAAVLLVTVGLFVFRYGMTGSLDLKPSLVEIAFEPFFEKSPEQLAKNNAAKLPKQLQVPDQDGSNPESDPNPDSMQTDNMLNAGENGENGNSDAPGDVKSKATTPPGQQQTEGANQGEQSGQDSQNAGADNNQDKGSNDKKGQEGKQQQNQQGKQGNQQGQNSLMDKMKDAMSSLMNKLKGNEKQGDQQQQQAQQQQGSQQNAKAQGQKQGQNSQSQNQQQSDSGEQGEQQGEGQRADNQQSKGQQKSADAGGPKDGKSGVGQQDGNKDRREAEQLEAMGKISEIIGKRTQQLSGEMMVEVNSSKQGIRTPYSNQVATHSDTGGNVNRDEVPLIYRQYVQRYFEEVRPAKQPSAKGAKQ